VLQLIHAPAIDHPTTDLSADPTTDVDARDSLHTLKFDRRRASRLPAAGEGSAAFHNKGTGARLAHAKLTDAGPGGLGLLCPVPASVGSSCTFYTASARGRVPFPPVRGTVVRCTMTAEGYRIGIRCDLSRAAA
jgi:hypothetical protein